MESKILAEYEYPEPINFVRSKYDLFAEDTEKRIIVEILQIQEDDFFDRFLYYHLKGMLKQQGETVLQAREMGLDDLAIAKLTGLTVQEIQEKSHCH